MEKGGGRGKGFFLLKIGGLWLGLFAAYEKIRAAVEVKGVWRQYPPPTWRKVGF